MNEVGLNAKWLGKDLTNEETQEFAKKVLNHMRERLSDYQEEYGDLYNLEATPAESTAFRLAKHDRKRYPDIKNAAKEGDTPYYTNSSHLPVGYTEDIFTALDIQDELQTLYTSGTVFHAFLGEKLPDWQAAAAIVKKIAENYRLPYYTLSPTYSVCRKHGYISGEHFTCPECGESAEVYSRITGYYRPVSNFNDGKAQEYRDRKEYDLDRSVLKKAGQPSPDNCCCGETMAEASLGDAPDYEDKYIIFATKTCPNCKVAAAMLEKAGISYEKLYVDENEEMAKKLELKQAPTLVIVNGDSSIKFAGVPAIRKYIDSVAK